MTESNQNYYKVVAKCGHVGRCHYVPIIFAVESTPVSETLFNCKVGVDIALIKHTVDHSEKFSRLLLNHVEVPLPSAEVPTLVNLIWIL